MLDVLIGIMLMSLVFYTASVSATALRQRAQLEEVRFSAVAVAVGLEDWMVDNTSLPAARTGGTPTMTWPANNTATNLQGDMTFLGVKLPPRVYVYDYQPLADAQYKLCVVYMPTTGPMAAWAGYDSATNSYDAAGTGSWTNAPAGTVCD